MKKARTEGSAARNDVIDGVLARDVTIDRSVCLFFADPRVFQRVGKGRRYVWLGLSLVHFGVVLSAS